MVLFVSPGDRSVGGRSSLASTASIDSRGAPPLRILYSQPLSRTLCVSWRATNFYAVQFVGLTWENLEGWSLSSHDFLLQLRANAPERAAGSTLDRKWSRRRWPLQRQLILSRDQNGGVLALAGLVESAGGIWGEVLECPFELNDAVGEEIHAISEVLDARRQGMDGDALSP